MCRTGGSGTGDCFDRLGQRRRAGGLGGDRVGGRTRAARPPAGRSSPAAPGRGCWPAARARPARSAPARPAHSRLVRQAARRPASSLVASSKPLLSAGASSGGRRKAALPRAVPLAVISGVVVTGSPAAARRLVEVAAVVDRVLDLGDQVGERVRALLGGQPLRRFRRAPRPAILPRLRCIAVDLDDVPAELGLDRADDRAGLRREGGRGDCARRRARRIRARVCGPTETSAALRPAGVAAVDEAGAALGPRGDLVGDVAVGDHRLADHADVLGAILRLVGLVICRDLRVGRGDAGDLLGADPRDPQHPLLGHHVAVAVGGIELLQLRHRSGSARRAKAAIGTSATSPSRASSSIEA